jgi:hypothetical protein
MTATRLALLALAILGVLHGDAAWAQDNRPPTANTMTVELGRARPILDSWRAGKGWAFASTKTDSRGRSFVRYQVLVGVEGSLTVGDKSQMLLKLSPETAWIPVDALDLPLLGGSASSLLREAQGEIDRSRNAVSPTEAGALAGTLPALIETIKPTIAGPGAIPPRVELK